jgi:hypothetical protein
MLSVALSTAAAIRVERVIRGAFCIEPLVKGTCSAAPAADTKRTKAKAQRASIGGYHTRFVASAKGFLPISAETLFRS